MTYRKVSTAKHAPRGWRSTAKKTLGIVRHSKIVHARKHRASGFGQSRKHK